MRVLMVSNDKTLLGKKGIGDAIKRHQDYADQVDHIDILVLTKTSEKDFDISKNCKARAVQVFGAKKKAVKIFKEGNYDLVVTQDPFITGSIGVYLKRIFGVRLIIHFHGDFFDNEYWLGEKFRHKIYKKMAERNIYYADSIRVVSKGIKDKLLQRGIADHNIYVISTPVNLPYFESDNFSYKKTDKKIVLTVGRIVEAKDYPTLIKAADLVYQKEPFLEWWIAGDGPLLEKYKKQTIGKDHIKWLGLISHQDLPSYYKRSYVTVLTSTNESFGKVFLEAAMAKKPSISTNTVGAQEIIKDGITGYIVPIKDEVRVAERVLYLLKNKLVAEQMGYAAYDYVKSKFGWEKNITKIISMWKQTVTDK